MSDLWQEVHEASVPKDERCIFWLGWAPGIKPEYAAVNEVPEYANPFIGTYRQWGACYRATHWMPLPGRPK